MMKILFLIFLAIPCIPVAFAPGAEKPGAPGARSAAEQLSALKSALAMLKLSAQERTQAADLAQSCDKQLDEQIERLKAAMKNKLIADTRGLLSEDHQRQFDGLLNAMQRRDETIDIATQQFEARLDEIGLGDLNLGKTGVRDEGQLIDRVCATDRNLREKYMVIKKKYQQARADGAGKLAAPDPKDKVARKAYQEQKEKLQAEADARLHEEARALLGDQQRAAIAQAMDAQRRWEQIVDAAKAAFDQEKNTLLGIAPKP